MNNQRYFELVAAHNQHCLETAEARAKAIHALGWAPENDVPTHRYIATTDELCRRVALQQNPQ